MKLPLVQILVVVASFQMKALKTEVEPYEQQLDILREGGGPFGRCNSLGKSTIPRMGMEVGLNVL